MSCARTIVAALSLSAAGPVAPSYACATRWAQGRAIACMCRTGRL